MRRITIHDEITDENRSVQTSEDDAQAAEVPTMVDAPADGATSSQRILSYDAMTPEQLFKFRESHGGRNPPGFRAADAMKAEGLTPQQIFDYRETHGGRGPNEEGSR